MRGETRFITAQRLIFGKTNLVLVIVSRLAYNKYIELWPDIRPYRP